MAFMMTAAGQRARLAAALLPALSLTACGGGDDDQETLVTRVSYRSLDPVKPLTVPAELRMPPGPARPAVVIVHGSSGIDSRGVSYAKELNAAGIATLEIDMWGRAASAARPAGPAACPRPCPMLMVR
ncbi:hypothetical protein [Roseateles cavernae]|uniref:hypothetical protein n=1 Tax=Roseateles cavernae TaxID=3153578 RepID=UPI0032E522A5